MGLDITAKSKIVTEKESPEAYEFNMLLDADTETLYINPDFPSHMNEYSTDSPDHLVNYLVTEDSKEHAFNAGSYASFNEFRNLLCVAINGIDAETVWENINKYEDKPLFKMINFSDCEGSMDSATAKTLLADFKEHRDTFVNHVTNYQNKAA